MHSNNKTETQKKIQKQTLIITLVLVGMFGFCYALIPLYNVFCKVTGLNGKTTNVAQTIDDAQTIDMTRTVTVELTSTLNGNIPYEFHAADKKFKLHPGEYVKTSYWVKNLTNAPMVVQAIPSVTPGLGAKHINKVECFCFINQPLEPGEGKDMTLVFTVDPELPKDIRTLTLAYTLFDVTKR